MYWELCSTRLWVRGLSLDVLCAGRSSVPVSRGLDLWVGAPGLSEPAPALLQVVMPFCVSDMIAAA